MNGTLRSRLLQATLLLGCASFLSGCVAAAMVDGADSLGTLVAGAPAGSPHTVQVFVASARAPERALAGQEAGEGAGEGVPRYSLATVSVPPGHEAGVIERPGLGSENRLRHFVAVGRRPLEEDSFRNELASHISGRIGSNRDVLLFVHGFNTGLDEARFRLAQIVIDGGFGGVPVLFAWPSRGSVFAYGSDRESATASRDALERVIATVSREQNVGKIHVLAHSMGAWLAMEALRETAIAGHPDLDGHLGDIILAAPDIDLAVFRGQMSRLGSYAHVSIFAASNDRALAVSSLLADRPRLGALDPSKAEDRSAIESLGVQVIDLSRDSTGFIGHGTYASVPQVVKGIGAEIGVARSEDGQTQAVLDGTEAVSEAPRVAKPSVVATPLPAPTLVPPPAVGAPGVPAAVPPEAGR